MGKFANILRFEEYDEKQWERTAFFLESGGFLVTSKQRLLKSSINKREYSKFQKERRMCLRYASFGFQIEHLSEYPGLSSPDVNIIRHPQKGGVVLVNGQRADLKSLSSANNIVRHAKYAIFKQKAELVLFEFPTRSSAIENTLKNLSNKKIHGYYYFSDEEGYNSF